MSDSSDYSPPPVTVLTGMTTLQLQTALARAQSALINLQTGSQGETFSYAQGDGTKSVTYTRVNMGGLTQLIGMLQQALGITARSRRPIRFVW